MTWVSPFCFNRVRMEFYELLIDPSYVHTWCLSNCMNLWMTPTILNQFWFFISNNKDNISLLHSHWRRNCRGYNTEREASRQMPGLHTSHQQHQPAASQSLALHRHDSWQAAGHWSPAADDVTEGRNDPTAAASWEYLPLWGRLEWWWRHQWEGACGLLTTVLWHIQDCHFEANRSV